MNARHAGVLQRIRHGIRDRAHVATCVGFGPRFLHSTGQAYKGGSDKGVFLQITADDARDLAVPGQAYTFGVIKAAQARGDFAVLAERGRRVAARPSRRRRRGRARNDRAPRRRGAPHAGALTRRLRHSLTFSRDLRCRLA